jgi:hypothetical protein
MSTFFPWIVMDPTTPSAMGALSALASWHAWCESCAAWQWHGRPFRWHSLEANQTRWQRKCTSTTIKMAGKLLAAGLVASLFQKGNIWWANLKHNKALFSIMLGLPLEPHHQQWGWEETLWHGKIMTKRNTHTHKQEICVGSLAWRIVGSASLI